MLYLLYYRPQNTAGVLIMYAPSSEYIPPHKESKCQTNIDRQTNTERKRETDRLK